MKNLVRSLKYFVSLSVLCLLVMWLNVVLHWSSLSFGEMFYVMFHTPRGMLLPAGILLASAFYPRFGFMTRRVEGFLEDHRTQVVNALLAAGYRLEGEEDETLRFRARSMWRRVQLRFDDEIKVSQYGQWIVLEGSRRGVALAAYRLECYLSELERDEK